MASGVEASSSRLAPPTFRVREKGAYVLQSDGAESCWTSETMRSPSLESERVELGLDAGAEGARTSSRWKADSGISRTTPKMPGAIAPAKIQNALRLYFNSQY